MKTSDHMLGKIFDGSTRTEPALKLGPHVIIPPPTIVAVGTNFLKFGNAVVQCINGHSSSYFWLVIVATSSLLDEQGSEPASSTDIKLL